MKTALLKDSKHLLPVGLLLPDDGPSGYRRVREFELGPITGRVQLALGDKEVKDNPGRRTTETLLLTLKKLGEMSAIPRDLIRQLTFADREYLCWLHMVRRAGDEPFDVETECSNPSCKAGITAQVGADSLLVNILEDGDFEPYVETTKGENDKPLRRVYPAFRFTHERYGTLLVRMLSGEDEERYSILGKKNPAEAGMRNVHAAIITLNDKKLTYDEFLDREETALDWIGATMDSLDIGATQLVRIKCENCAQETSAPMSPFEILLHSQETKVVPPYETRSSS